MAFFEGLVMGEDGEPVEVTYVGTTAYYVVDDQGFRRHIEARAVDRPVLEQFMEQLKEHREEAVTAMLLQVDGIRAHVTRGEFDAPVVAKWSDLGITGKHLVRDCWRQKDLGAFADSFSSDVGRRGVTLIRIRPAGK